MILYGASGHGLVIADTLRLLGVDHLVFWDDQPGKTLPGFNVTPPLPETDEEVILSIGSNRVRRLIDRRSAYRYGTAVHPTVIRSAGVPIGEGTVIMAGAILNTGARVGRHCIVNTAAVVDHEVILGDYVHVSPNATLCGLVQVGEGAWIGAGSVVIQEVTIGRWAVVGAGAVVIADVPDGAVVVGNPARIVRMSSGE